MEAHVVGVHGLDGPKEMYIDDQSSLVRSVSDTHDSKSIPRPLEVNDFTETPPGSNPPCGDYFSMEELINGTTY